MSQLCHGLYCRQSSKASFTPLYSRPSFNETKLSANPFLFPLRAPRKTHLTFETERKHSKSERHTLFMENCRVGSSSSGLFVEPSDRQKGRSDIGTLIWSHQRREKWGSLLPMTHCQALTSQSSSRPLGDVPPHFRQDSAQFSELSSISPVPATKRSSLLYYLWGTLRPPLEVWESGE